MSMLRLEIEPHDPPSARKIARAIEVLDRGGVAAYPTDTVYALGCALDARKGVERIYRARDMASKHRLAMICPDVSAAATYAHFNQVAFRVARTIFPGPFTMVLPATREVPRQLWDDKRRRVIGIRIPAHPVTRALVAALGRPLLTTSAVPNDSDTACSDADELIEAFGRHLDLLVDSGPIHGEPSTVLEIEDDEVVVIRQGSGSLEDVAL